MTEPVSVQNQNTNLHSIVNVAMSSAVTKELLQLLNSTDKFTFKKIIKFITLLSLDELRKLTTTLLNYMSSNLSGNILIIIDWIKQYVINGFCINILSKFFFKLISKLYIFKKKKEQPTFVAPYMHSPKQLHSEIDISDSFMKILVNYIEERSNKENFPIASYNLLNTPTLLVENLETIQIQEDWTNIKINFDTYSINIKSPLTINFKKNKGKKYYDKYITETKERNIDLSTITTFSDLLPDCEFKTKLQEHSDVRYKNHIKPTGVRSNITHGVDSASRQYIEYNIAGFIEYKMPHTYYHETVMQIKIISVINTKLGNKLLNIFKNDINVGDIVSIFGINFTITKNDLKYFEKTPHTIKELDFSKEFALENEQLYKDIPYDFIKIIKPNATDKKTPKKSLLFNVQSINYDNTIMYEKLLNFVEYINSYTEDNSIKKPVKSFIISIKSTEKKENIANPDYEIYQQEKNKLMEFTKMTDSLSKSSIDDMQMKLMFEEVMKKECPKTIEKVINEKKVNVEEVNEIYKKHDTLYLRENNMRKLQNALDMFINDKQFMEDIGLQNKLGILLHGLPGTGKSSTIQYIATFLKKDIYCVDFKTIKTNSDFNAVIKHVTSNCVNGGILTFEDFDAMGDVFHKRANLYESSNVQLMKSADNELTLDYILNVFQGSLTPNNFVFVATTNVLLESFDDALCRIGRFDVIIDMKLCDRHQINSIYKKIMRKQLDDKLLERIEEDKWKPVEIIYRLKDFVKSNESDEIILKPFFK